MNDPRHETLCEALRWALDASSDPAVASADWLARDINPSCASAVDLLTDEGTTVAQLQQAKSAFKTMRIVGETTADRRIGARLYLAAIAAALVRHGRRISRQSDSALDRGLRRMVDDQRVPERLRALAGTALHVLRQMTASDYVAVNGHTAGDVDILAPLEDPQDESDETVADDASPHAPVHRDSGDPDDSDDFLPLQ